MQSFVRFHVWGHVLYLWHRPTWWLYIHPTILTLSPTAFFADIKNKRGAADKAIPCLYRHILAFIAFRWISYTTDISHTIAAMMRNNGELPQLPQSPKRMSM